MAKRNPDLARAHNLILDVKKELANLTTFKGDGSIIIDPLDHTSFGFDPFWRLDETSSDPEVYEVMHDVAISLIPPMTGDNSFFSEQAKELLKGCFVYYFKYKGYRTFTAVLRATLSQPIKKTIEEIIANTEPGSPAYISVIDFADVDYIIGEDGKIKKIRKIEVQETTLNIFMNFKSRAATLLADQHLAYALGDNPHKFRPDMLLGHDVYLCIPKNKMDAWGQFVYMTFNSVLQWIMGLDEIRGSDRKPIGIILDEIVALLDGMGGQLSALVNTLRLARSVGCAVILCCQSVSGLRCVYSDHQVDDMLSNLPWRVYLDATTPATQKAISESAGTYRERQVSFSKDGKRQSKTTQYVDKPIIVPSDLTTLGGSDEAILITTKTGYCRTKKLPYFKSKFFKKILDYIKMKRDKSLLQEEVKYDL